MYGAKKSGRFIQYITHGGHQSLQTGFCSFWPQKEMDGEDKIGDKREWRRRNNDDEANQNKRQ